MEDVAIIDLFYRRTENAISELLIRYERLFVSLAKNILDNEQDIEECVNDAMLDVWNSIPPHKPRSLAAFGCSIVRNRALDKYRYLCAQKRAPNACSALVSELDECIGHNDVEEQIDKIELCHSINLFLDSLDKTNRVIFVKRYFFAMGIKEIAKETMLSENAVSVRLSRMRDKLRCLLEERGAFA